MALCMKLFSKAVVAELQFIHKEDPTSEEGRIAGASADLFGKMERYYFLMVEDQSTTFQNKVMNNVSENLILNIINFH